MQYRQLISEAHTFLWLWRGDLRPETGSSITNQTLLTQYHATKILQTETDGKCRLCQQFGETMDHIISPCPILAKEHDSVCSTTV